MAERDEITIGEAVGFWKNNKSWILPAIMAILGMLGGANADKVGAILPNTPETISVVKRVDDLEVRVSKLEKPATKSEDDGIIHLGK